MSDQAQTPEPAPEPAREQVTAAAAAAPTEPAPVPEQPVELPPVPPGSAESVVTERPEVAVGAAFAGGLVLAMILKRLGR